MSLVLLNLMEDLVHLRSQTGNTITVKDVIVDAGLQIITRPAEYGVLATMNLNGTTSSMLWLPK